MANNLDDAAIVAQAVAVFAQLNEEEEADIEEAILILAQIALPEIMEMEEPDVDARELLSNWIYVTVNINEYHAMVSSVFKLHFRMSRGVFEALVQTLGNHLVEKGRLKRVRTSLQDIVMMVVWLLATPDCFRSVALRFGKHPNTLYYFYSYIIEALRELAPRFITWPGEEERNEIKASFQGATGFPGVVGCIDGTHINLSAPVEDAALYVNRHDTYSTNVQAVVDHELLVRNLYVGEIGSMHDKRVFRRSPLCRDLLNPQEERILDADDHLLGDGGYVLTNFMMIPFPNDGHLSEEQRQFNRTLSQARVRVENAFARAKGKWRRLKYLHARNPAIVVDHITACFVLHNFLIVNGDPIWGDGELERPIRDDQVLGNENFDDQDEDVDNPNEGQNADQLRMEEAQIMGAEKRIFIMTHMLNLG